MSGTSLDGVDVALICTDGEIVYETGPGKTYPFSVSLRERLQGCLGCHDFTPEIQELERDLTIFHGEVVKDFLQHYLDYQVDLIGFHGQTLFHKPPVTRQIGDGELLSEITGIDVIYDFRTADVEAGGQGAPLVPVYHQSLAHLLPKPLVIVNIGGVANITWIAEGQLIACDTGPGGALLDDWMKKTLGQAFDWDGSTARQGKINHLLLDKWVRHPFFDQSAPKSLDRESFKKCLQDIADLSPEDGAATLTEFTACGIVKAIQMMSEPAQGVFLAGGGRHNIFLKERIAHHWGRAVQSVEEIDWDGDFLEAQAFAFLAVRVKHELPTSFPSTTGVRSATCGGRLVKANFNTPDLFRNLSDSSS